MIRFRRLRIEGYGRFGALHEFEFAEGLNLIVGENESGKSTLLSALLDALYANPNSTAREVRERVHWGHPHGWRLELDLVVGKEPVQIIKFHPQDDPRRRGEFLLHYRGRTFAGEQAQAEWEQLWKMPREVYLATACVRQREMARLAKDRSLATLQQQLRESALSTDLEPIYRQIQNHRRELQQQLKAQEQRLQQLTESYRSAQQRNQEARTYRARLAELRDQIETVQQAIAHEETFLQRWQNLRQTIESLQKKREEAGHIQNQLQQIETLAHEKERIEAELRKDFDEFSRLDANHHEKVRAEYERYQRARAQEQATASQLSELSLQYQRAVGQSRARVGLAGMGLAIAVAGFILSSSSPILGGSAIGLGMLLLLFGLLWRPKHGVELMAQRRILETQHQQAETERVQAERNLVARLHEAGFTELRLPSPERNGGTYDLASDFAYAVARFEERWARYQHLRVEQMRISAQYQALTQTRTPEELQARLALLSTEIVGLTQTLNLDPIGKELLNTPAEEFSRREVQLEMLKRNLEEAQREYHRTEGLLQATLVSEDPETLQLLLQQAQTYYDHLQHRIRLLEATRTLLEEANRRYLSDLSHQLQPRIEHYLPTLTRSRYTQITMGDNLELRVFHSTKGEPITLEEENPAWSAGTLDQLFFACRLGLTDALSGDARVPLLLDEPLVYADDSRLADALTLIAQVAQHTQVLYFTCRQAFQVPAHVVRLD